MPNCYSEQLRDPRWQRKRLEILNRDKFTCQLCDDTKTELQIHHKEYKRGCKPWEYDSDNFLTLCKHCHENVTKEKVIPYRVYKNIHEDGAMAFVSVDHEGVHVTTLGIATLTIKPETLKEMIETIDKKLSSV